MSYDENIFVKSWPDDIDIICKSETPMPSIKK